MKTFRAYGMKFRTDLDLADDLPLVKQAGAVHCVLSKAGRAAVPRREPGEVFEFVVHDQAVQFWLDVAGENGREVRSWGMAVQPGTWIWGDVPTGHMNYHLLGGKTWVESREKLPFWLIHAGLPLHAALTLDGLWLHAAAVELEGRTVVITGPSQAGKSTLVEALVARGCNLVSDDKLRLLVSEREVLAVPSHPRNRASRARQELGRAQPFAARELTVTCILCLQRSAIASMPMISDITGVEAFRETHANRLFGFLPPARQELQIQAKLLNSVRVGRLTIPDDMSRLTEAVDAIVSHQWSTNTA